MSAAIKTVQAEMAAIEPITIKAFSLVDVTIEAPDPEYAELSSPAAALLLLPVLVYELSKYSQQKPAAAQVISLDASLEYYSTKHFLYGEEYFITFSLGIESASAGSGSFSYKVIANLDGTRVNMADTPSEPIIKSPSSANSPYTITFSSTSSLMEHSKVQIEISVDYIGAYCTWTPTKIIIDFKNGIVRTEF